MLLLLLLLLQLSTAYNCYEQPLLLVLCSYYDLTSICSSFFCCCQNFYPYCLFSEEHCHCLKMFDPDLMLTVPFAVLLILSQSLPKEKMKKRRIYKILVTNGIHQRLQFHDCCFILLLLLCLIVVIIIYLFIYFGNN